MNDSQRLFPVVVGLVGLTVVGSGAIAQPALADTEPNDSFENREVLSEGTTRVDGELTLRFDPTEYDYTFSGSLAPGEASSFDVPDLTPGDPFYAWIDNGENGPDTVLGVFNEDNVLVGADDDSSPVGNGTASGVGGVVNPDGSVRLGVTGFPDYEFQSLKQSGTMVHEQLGNYDVRVKLGTDVPEGDVDYYSFTGLTPGSEFVVELTQGSFDSVMVWLDDEGEPVYSDDDGGLDLLSRLRGFVPLSGDVNIAVSAFGDPEFTGNHIESGIYTLTLTTPEQR